MRPCNLKRHINREKTTDHVSRKSEQRPMSPYMIGPYYRPQLTSILSITSRLTGVFLTVVSTPLILWWCLALMAGPEAFSTVSAFMGSLPGHALLLFSLLSICYHLMNGIRHMIWDTGRMLEIEQVYRSGWVMLAAAASLFAFIWWASS